MGFFQPLEGMPHAFQSSTCWDHVRVAGYLDTARLDAINLCGTVRLKVSMQWHACTKS